MADIERETEAPVAEAATVPRRFARLLAALHRRAGRRVVVLVDEYDKPILDALDEPAIAMANRDDLRGLYGTIKDCDAHVELAEFQGHRGSATESFARGGRELHHGNDLLEGSVYGYDPSKWFGQSSHTLNNIWAAMDCAFVHPGSARKAKRIIAEYTVLDAIIGNTDRHHENWGLLRRRTAASWRGMVAPSFDHASSLGRELQDARRRRLLAENRVGSYMERGRGAIYWEEDGPPISPLELVRRAVAEHGDYFLPALAKLRGMEEGSVAAIVNRIPNDWMSAPARTFAIALMCYNLHQLQDLAR